VWHRVVACPLYCFSVFINDLLIEVEKAGLGVQLNNGKSIGGLLFVDDLVGMSDSSENLQKLIDVVHKFCNRWQDAHAQTVYTRPHFPPLMQPGYGTSTSCTYSTCTCTCTVSTLYVCVR